MPRTFRLILMLVVGAVGVTLSAQQAPGQQPVFRTSVELIHLDVSVLDKERRPVRGLTAKDFTVYEDGRPQPVVAFSAVDVPDPEPAVAAWVRESSPEIQTNQVAGDSEGRLFVLLMDDAMIPPMPGALETAKEFARKFVSRLPPSDRVAVVFTASGKNQNFTNDRQKLLAAVNSMQPGFARHLRGWESSIDPMTPAEVADFLGPTGPMSDPDMGFRMAALATLRQVADTLISAPQRRKALLYVSPGIPVDEASAAMLDRPGLFSRAMMRDANRALVAEMPELFRRMQRANVTVYPIDPCGAGGFEAYVLNAASGLNTLRDQSDPSTNEAPARALTTPMTDWLATPAPGTPPPDAAWLARHMASLNLEFMDTLASNTGGLAITRTNDYDAGLERIFVENASYYLLGYPMPSGHGPATQHRIRVEVNRPGLTVRTRSGYVTEPAPKRGRAAVRSPLDVAISGPVPNAAFPMRASFAPFAVPGKPPVVLITLGLSQPPVTSRTRVDVEMQTNAYTPTGKAVITGRRHLANVVLVPSRRGDEPRYDLLTDISLPPGRYELRISAHRSHDNVSGSLYADIDVPDFESDELSASGVLIELEPAELAAPPNAFDALVPVVPTSNRQFRRGDAATAFMRVYQGAGSSILPVTVATRIVDERDRTVGEGRDRIEASAFRARGRAADYRFPIPAAFLPPGRYLLTFDISVGPTKTTRSVQFEITTR